MSTEEAPEDESLEHESADGDGSAGPADSDSGSEGIRDLEGDQVSDGNQHEDALTDADLAGAEVLAAHIAELVGLDPPHFDRSVITEAIGRSSEDTTKWWRAMGLVEVPDGVVAFGEDDRAMAASMANLLSAEPFAESQILRLARLQGASFARLADAQMELMEWLMVRAGVSVDDPLARTELLEDPAIQQLIEIYEASILYIWRRHLYGAMGRWIGADDDDNIEVVGFVDIAEFSSFSREMEPEELTAVVEVFEQSAMDLVSTHDGRVVKFIGDGVMFVADTVESAVEIAVSLQDRMKEQDPPIWLHSGVAEGPVVTIGGDVFGNTVNLASRLSETARKGRVLLPRDSVGDLAEREDLQVQRVRRVSELKGVGRTHLSSICRLSPEKIQAARDKAAREELVRKEELAREEEKERKDKVREEEKALKEQAREEEKARKDKAREEEKARKEEEKARKERVREEEKALKEQAREEEKAVKEQAREEEKAREHKAREEASDDSEDQSD